MYMFKENTVPKMINFYLFHEHFMHENLGWACPYRVNVGIVSHTNAFVTVELN